MKRPTLYFTAMMHKRHFLWLLLIPGAAFFYAFFIEPNRITLTEHTILPERLAKHRIVHVTDLHLKKLNSFNKRVADRIVSLKPDMILFTGDMVDTPEAMKDFRQFMKILPNVPTFAIIGNWEIWCRFPSEQLRELYSTENVQFLFNESVSLTLNGEQVTITGLDDLCAGVPSLPYAVANASPNERHIVLTHSPLQVEKLFERNMLTKEEPQEVSIDIVLSGHTHGGQATLFGIPLFLPYGSGDYLHGAFNTTPPLFVSRGIGTSILPIRFCAPPEIVLHHW